jgi:hypothetical protein
MVAQFRAVNHLYHNSCSYVLEFETTLSSDSNKLNVSGDLVQLFISLAGHEQSTCTAIIEAPISDDKRVFVRLHITTINISHPTI